MAMQKPPPKKKGPSKPEPPKRETPPMQGKKPPSRYGEAVYGQSTYGGDDPEPPREKETFRLGEGRLGEASLGGKTENEKVKAKTTRGTVKGQKAKINLKAENLKTGKPKLSKPELKEATGKAKGSSKAEARTEKPKVYKKTISAKAKGTASFKKSSPPPPKKKIKEKGRNYYVYKQIDPGLDLRRLNREVSKAEKAGNVEPVQSRDTVFLFRTEKRERKFTGVGTFNMNEETRNIRGITYDKTAEPVSDPFIEEFLFNVAKNPNIEKFKTVPSFFQVYKSTANDIMGIFQEFLLGEENLSILAGASGSSQKVKSATGTAKGGSTASAEGEGFIIPDDKSPAKKVGETQELLPLRYFAFASRDTGFDATKIIFDLEELAEINTNFRVNDHDIIFTITEENGRLGVYGWGEVGKVGVRSGDKTRRFFMIETIHLRKSHQPVGDDKFFRGLYTQANRTAPSKENDRPLIFQLGDSQAKKIISFLDYFPQPIKLIDENEPKPPTNLDTKAPTFSDGPTSQDHLGRTKMADTFAVRLKDMWEENIEQEDEDPFIIHLNAPWGAGKTSFYKNTKKFLGAQRPDWAAVNFNAWQHQHINPPWWSLLQETYRQSTAQLKPAEPTLAYKIKIKETFRRFLAGRHSFIFGAFLFALFMYFGTGEIEFWNGLATALGGVATIGALFHETLLGSSAKTAEAYSKLSKDPQIRLKGHFKKLIMDIQRPVLIFIDDIDRCRPDYVVGLLEGLMTLFRSKRCIFLIAGDARWIQKCFEVIYPDFIEISKKPGKNLGHHFLEKVFQFSLTLPAISKETMEQYMAFLLKQDLEEQIRLQGEGATPELQKQLTDEVKKKAQKFEADEIALEEAMEAFKNPEVKKKTRHLLMDYVDLMEPNPRAMKRLINAYIASAMAQVSYQRGQLNDEEQNRLVLWTIFTHRWPVLEEYFIQNPNLIDAALKFMKGQKSGVANVEKESILQHFKNHQDIKNLLERGLDKRGINFFLGLAGEAIEETQA